MPLTLFSGLRPIDRRQALRDCLAGVNLASINLPQVLGYARIAGMPVVAGFYTLLLPLVGFAVFGSSRHLVVAADSATAAIIAGSLSHSAVPVRAPFETRNEGTDSLLCRTARGGENFAGKIHSASDGAEIRARFTGRGSRRS
jgi:MFS superfamily sulfate permease-like transporter